MIHIRLSHLIYIAIFITSLEDRLLQVQALQTKYEILDFEDATAIPNGKTVTNLKDPLPFSITRKEYRQRKRRLLRKKRRVNSKQYDHKDHNDGRSNRADTIGTKENNNSSFESSVLSSTLMIPNNKKEERGHRNFFLSPEGREQNSANIDAFVRHATSLEGKHIIETQNQKTKKGQRRLLGNDLPPIAFHGNTIGKTSNESLIRSSMMGIRHLRKATSQDKILKDKKLKQDNIARFRKGAFVLHR